MKIHKIYRSIYRFKDKENALSFLGPYQRMSEKVGMHDEGTAEYIADLFVKGHTITFGELTDTTNDGFVEGDLLGIDIDNEDENKEKASDEFYLTPEEAVQMAKTAGLKPAFIYSSFNDKEDHRKFRLVFALEEPVTKKTRPQVIESLMSVFTKGGTCLADPKCRNHTRLFFGGKELVYTDFASTNSLTSIIHANKPFKQFLSAKSSQNNVIHECNTPVVNAGGDIYTTSPELECIRQQDAEGLRELLVAKEFQYEYGLDLGAVMPIEKLDVFNFLGSLPLHEVLGVGMKTSCILPGHRDSDPSAFIGEHEGKYRYRCHGCGGYTDEKGDARVRAYDLISLVMLFGNRSTKGAIEFLQKALNVEFESKWQREMKRELEYDRRYMQSPQWAERFPVAAQTLKKGNRSYGIALEILLYASDNINYKSLAICERPTFFLGKRKMSQLLQDKGMSGASETSCQNKLNDLKRWGFIVEAADSDLRPEVVAKARELQAKRSEELIQAGRRTGCEYRQAFYMIPNLTAAKWQEIENRIISEKTNGYRRGSRSVTQAYNYDLEVAKETYAQINVEKKPKKVLELEQKVLRIAAKLMEQHGFLTESDIKSQLRGYADKKKDALLVNTMPRIMRELKLAKERVNKEIRSRYSLDKAYASNSTIYIPR